LKGAYLDVSVKSRLTGPAAGTGVHVLIKTGFLLSQE